MHGPVRFLDLSCPECNWAEHCGAAAVARWLRLARKVRPGQEPELEIMHEVLFATAATLTCPDCGRSGLLATAAEEPHWPESTLCEMCRKPIPKQRLEALPDSTLCAACQQDEDLGRAPPSTEYCPRCGSAMEVRQSRRSGITRYVMACTANPPCRP